MAKIQFDVSTEDAIHTILGAVSLISGKTILNGEKYFSPHIYEDQGYKIIEDALAASAKVLDLELFDGCLTEGVAWIEGSKEQ